MPHDDKNIGILKSIWTRRPDGRWGVHGMKGLMLKPKAGYNADYFAFESEMELLTSSPPANLTDMFSSFGPTDFLVKQSIVPVVAWVTGATSIRCIGTAFIVSCTGYVVTASHVLLDPQENGYAHAVSDGGRIELIDNMMMGVIVPLSPATGINGFRVIPFEQAWYWGQWKESPLLHEGKRHESLTDVAVCKLSPLSDGGAFQPLHLSLNPFTKEEMAYVVGYAGIEDIPVDYVDGNPVIGDFDWELYVSVGKVSEIFPLNHVHKKVPTPGPCFDFKAHVPGKMSGAPIFGAQGSIVRGIVSRSFSGEKHAYGCMIGPVMTLPFGSGQSLKTIMDGGNEGMAVVRGQGL